jgi:hypothetical protein
MIATTISNSINENPVCFRIARPSGFRSSITMHAEDRFGIIGRESLKSVLRSRIGT